MFGFKTRDISNFKGVVSTLLITAAILVIIQVADQYRDHNIMYTRDFNRHRLESALPPLPRLALRVAEPREARAVRPVASFNFRASSDL